jgi:hypothetical protein
VFLGLIPGILVNAVLPLVAYTILTGRGWSPVAALSTSAAFPVIATLVSIARTRSLDGLALISLILIVLGLLGSLVTGSPRFHLVKESVLTGVFGIAFAVSLALPRPLAFFFGRQFATAGDPPECRPGTAIGCIHSSGGFNIRSRRCGRPSCSSMPAFGWS